MKYTLIGKSPDFNQNSLISIFRKYRLLIAEAYTFEETLGELANLNEE